MHLSDNFTVNTRALITQECWVYIYLYTPMLCDAGKQQNMCVNLHEAEKVIKDQ